MAQISQGLVFSPGELGNFWDTRGPRGRAALNAHGRKQYWATTPVGQWPISTRRRQTNQQPNIFVIA